jgi:agmatinase
MSREDEPVPPFLGDEAAEPAFERARAAILPVPYEATVSWGRGTARGPEMILRASPHLEFYDEQMGIEPWRWGIWTAPPLADLGGSPAGAAERISARVGEMLDAGKWVVMLGGEHSITPGAVRAAAARHAGLHVVQLDAHADLREDYDGDPWSHACAMAHCIGLAPIHAIGIRAYDVAEAARIRRGLPGYRLIHAWEMDGEEWVERALEGLAGMPVYLTFDVDYFDPSIMPATGTPEPGGGRWYPTLRLLEQLFERARVVACDVVELAPHEALHHADFTAARLVYKLIALAQGGRARAPGRPGLPG